MGKLGKRGRDDDPTRSDSDDLDYGAASSRPRPQGRSRKPKGASPRKPAKRQRQTYGDSEDDIEASSASNSEEEASSGGTDIEDQHLPKNPRTGRSVRSVVAKKAVKYEESDDEEEETGATESERDVLQPTPAKTRRRPEPKEKASRPGGVYLTIKGIIMGEEGKPVWAQPGVHRASVKRGSRPAAQATTTTRRSSRISHDEQAPLVALSASMKNETVVRRGTATPEPQPTRRPTRSSKGVKKPPSAIMEESQEDSVVDQPPASQPDLFSQIEEAAAEPQVPRTSPEATVEDAPQDDDIQMEYADDEEEEARIVLESQPDENENDEDEEPIVRGGRALRSHKKPSSPPTSQPLVGAASRRSLRNRKPGIEASSDFEPDADGEPEVEEEISDSDDVQKSRRGRSSNEGSAGGRRSGRSTRKPVSQRSRSRRHASEEEADEDLDPDEIADEAAELDEDARRNRRPRTRKSQRPEIAYDEPKLRNRANKPDYRILRPELILPIDDDDEPAVSATTPHRSRRGAGRQPYRSLFSTFGPFGGAGGPPPVFGGPEGTGATGGVDSDSSDDDMAPRGMQPGVGGAVGMTPTSAFPKPFVPQTHNADSVQNGSGGGGPSSLGKVKDRKLLADADPLGVDTNVTFDGVGGLDGHINQLKEMVMLPLLYPEVFQRFHVTPPRGVLFHGPPGTGKTLLARALASSVSSQGQKVTFYMRKGADALSKWVGEAEKQLRLLFEEARKNQPSIIFFDEIDGLAPVRSSKQEQIHASIVATLLALMDGMDGRGQVIVIGATNRPDSVDPALRRPGRFDREFYFPLPDQIGRRKILDIHTKGWEPPLKPEFKDELAEITRGYGGADLRALCTEAALNAVQGTYPQIYSSDKKLVIDPSTIKVLAKDFMISVNKIVPSSERSAASGAAPLKKDLEPLLRHSLAEITELVDQAIPRKRKATALEEAMYDDRDDELGFQKETLHRNFESSRIFRPRLLIQGKEGMGQQYLGAALLTKLEGLHVQNFDLPTLMKDSARTPEAAVVQLFEEVKRHKPGVIYIPNVNIWYETMADSVIKTFVGLLRSLQPTDPVLLLGIMEVDSSERDVPDVTGRMIRDLFGYSMKNSYLIKRPRVEARQEYFTTVIDFIRKKPSDFPEPQARKKRKLAELPVAPNPQAPAGPTKADTRAQKKKDRQTLNMLKLYIQSVMDQIKLKYKKFRTSVVDQGLIGYLLDEQDPEVLTTDLGETQRQEQLLFRPYELAKDAKGCDGLREVASGKFFYNLEIVTIEKRLSNGYYKRPNDFLADIKRLAKDAKSSGDQDRLIKANEMLANVEVDMATLEQQQPAMVAECEAVYEREMERERHRVEKLREAQRQGEDVPKIIPNVPPPHGSKTTTEDSGPVMLGLEIPGRAAVPPATPSRLGGPSPMSNLWSSTNDSHPLTNGSSVPSRPQEDTEMLDTQPFDLGSQSQPGADVHYSQSQELPNTQLPPGSQSQFLQHSAHTQVAPGSQLDQYQNSASTTTSGTKISDRSNRNSDHSGGRFNPGDHADFSILGPSGGSELPDTQEHSLQSHPSQAASSRVSSRQGHREPTIGNLLNSPEAETPVEPEVDADAGREVLLDEFALSQAHKDLVDKSSGLSLEQLEQVNASVMNVIWDMRGEWNRTMVMVAVLKAFNEAIADIEACQVVLDPSQKH